MKKDKQIDILKDENLELKHDIFELILDNSQLETRGKKSKNILATNAVSIYIFQ